MLGDVMALFHDLAPADEDIAHGVLIASEHHGVEHGIVPPAEEARRLAIQHHEIGSKARCDRTEGPARRQRPARQRPTPERSADMPLRTLAGATCCGPARAQRRIAALRSGVRRWRAGRGRPAGPWVRSPPAFEPIS